MKTNIELAKECGAFVWEENTETPNGCYSKGDCMMTEKQLDAIVAAAIEQATAELRHENANNKAAAELLKHALDKSEEMVAMLRDALKHLEHNARKSGAEMGLGLDVAKDALNKSAEAYEKRIKVDAPQDAIDAMPRWTGGDWADAIREIQKKKFKAIQKSRKCENGKIYK